MAQAKRSPEMSASNNAEKTQPRGRPFKRGNPGGPGRPEGSRNRATLILDALADGEAEDVLLKTVGLAKGGDLRAAEIILSRVWPQRKGRPVTFDLPSLDSSSGVLATLRSVFEATARGELTPDEAALVGNLLEANRKAIETIQFEERISRLEEQKK